MSTNTISPEENLLHQFKDTEGRLWTVRFTLGIAKFIDDIDFSNVTDVKFSMLEPTQELFTRVLHDIKSLFAVIWLVVSYVDQSGTSQVEQHFHEKVTEENQERLQQKFMDAVGGDVIELARIAAWGAAADFFPRHKTVLLNMIQQYRKVHERVDLKVNTMGEKVDQMIDQYLDSQMDNLMEELKQQ
jgi:hypothetical protein